MLTVLVVTPDVLLFTVVCLASRELRDEIAEEVIALEEAVTVSVVVDIEEVDVIGVSDELADISEEYV